MLKNTSPSRTFPYHAMHSLLIGSNFHDEPYIMNIATIILSSELIGAAAIRAWKLLARLRKVLFLPM